MAYNEFAYFYDELNSEADYDALYRYVTDELAAHGIRDGILADLGCGTGDLTLMLAQAGYDVIGIDRSEEMLSVLREKADELDMTGCILLLRQDLLSLDLYGTIRAAVSTFDTYNHIGPVDQFEKAIRKAAYFMEKDGVFIFDLNTPYKHQKILAANSANTVPCMMPYIDAFFMPRAAGDRPDVVPEGAVNFAFLGQFAETERDTIFTTEYSIRTGMEAVYTLLNVDRGVPEVWGSVYDIRCLLDATVKLRDGKKITDMEMPLVGKLALKEALKKIEGTEVEKLLKEYNVI